MVEPEVDQSSEVDGGDAEGETELVPFHAAVPDPAVIVGHQPCDGPLDHRSQSAVLLGEVPFTPSPAGLDQFICRGM